MTRRTPWNADLWYEADPPIQARRGGTVRVRRFALLWATKFGPVGAQCVMAKVIPVENRYDTLIQQSVGIVSYNLVPGSVEPHHLALVVDHGLDVDRSTPQAL